MILNCIENSTMLANIDEQPFIKLNGCDDDILRFELDPLSEAGQAVAEKELRETPEIKAQAITELRTLLQGKIGIVHINITLHVVCGTARCFVCVSV